VNEEHGPHWRNMMKIEAEKNYTSDEVAETLRVSSSWVRQKIMQNKLPVTRIGKKVFVKGSTILHIYKNGFSL
jgi:excisionase family DNA binding protein